MSQVWAYVLLLLDLAVGAAALWFYLVAVVWVIGRLRRRRRPPGKEAAEAAESTASSAATTRRRCENCGTRWSAVPSTEVSLTGLKVRRSIRRYRRRLGRPPVQWAARQGWSRCPSCLSRQVRDSRRQEADRRPTDSAADSQGSGSRAVRQ